MSNSSWKYTAIALGAVLVASNAWWFYQTLDAGVTASYREQTAQECETSAKQLEVIANYYVAGKPVSEVQPFLFSTAAANDTFPKPEEQLIVIGNVSLQLNPDRTVKALVRDPYEP
jgi:hypothetical protein